MCGNYSREETIQGWKLYEEIWYSFCKLLLLKNICLQPFQLSPKLQDLLGIDQLAIPEGKIKRMLTRTCLNQDWISNQFLIYVTTYSYGLSGTREAKKYWVGKTPNFLWTFRNFKVSWFHYIDVFILFVWILGGQMPTLATHFPGPWLWSVGLLSIRLVPRYQFSCQKCLNLI